MVKNARCIIMSVLLSYIINYNINLWGSTIDNHCVRKQYCNTSETWHNLYKIDLVKIVKFKIKLFYDLGCKILNENVMQTFM